MSANLNRQTEDFEDLNFQEESMPKYQEFQDFDDNRTKLDELIFFAKLAFFCVTTILVCFILLVAKFSPTFAFPLAMLISWGITALAQKGLKRLKH